MRRVCGIPRALACVAASACLAASVALSGCASPTASSVSSSTPAANRVEEIGRDIADLEIDVNTWNAFTANSTAAVFGV